MNGHRHYMTLGDLRKALNKFDKSYDDRLALLIRTNPATKNKTVEYIFSGLIVVYRDNTKFTPITMNKE